MDNSLLVEGRRAGVLLPLSSLLSKYSFESGDFYSLYPLAEWCQKTGFSLIQLLPLNDTGIGYSPYSAISSFAIDPIFISLHLLNLPHRSRKKEIITLHNHPIRIRNKKLEILFEHFRSQGKSIENSIDSFLNMNPWLYEYVTFRILYNDYVGTNWWEWKKEDQIPELAKEKVWKTKLEECRFIAYLQFVAFSQLKKCKEDLEQKGIFLKGDMPILTARNSCDVWSRPDQFLFEYQAGAPPDAFSEDGQTWGFPILNWEYLQKQKYSWWRDRLIYMQNFFHLYRVDHVIGMYRIWCLPKESSTAKHGWFHPQTGVLREEFLSRGLDPEDFVKRKLIYEFLPNRFIFFWDFWKNQSYQELGEDQKAKLFPLSQLHIQEEEAHWKKQGEEILNFLMENSSMIPCVEDLGAVPSFIRDSLHGLALRGIDVVRWTRSFSDGSWIPASSYRKKAISVLSTHDTAIALDWWKQTSKVEDLSFFWKNKRESPPESLEEVNKLLLEFVFETESEYSIQLLSDLCFGENSILENPELHRINIPGTADTQNWTYRFPFFAEDLLQKTDQNLYLAALLKRTNRFAF